MGKLRDTPEGAGRLIDNTVLVMLYEAGHGTDTATGVKNSDWQHRYGSRKA